MHSDKKSLKLVDVIAIGFFTAVTAAMALFVRFFSEANPSHTASIMKTAAVVMAGNVLISAVVILRRHRNEKKQSIEDAAKVTDNINAMAILWNTDFSYINANDSLILATGYSNEELYDLEILKKVLPPDAFSTNLQAIVNNRDEEFFIQTKKGSQICTMWNTSIIRSAENNSNVFTLLSIGPNLTDINQMKNEIVSYSKKLRESQRRYALSMELSEIGILLKEKGSSRFHASEQLCAMLGLEASDGYLEGDVLREAFHPKDRIVFDSFASGKKLGSQGLLDHDEIHSVDFRAMSCDGDYHWYNFRYKSVNAAEGGVNLGGAVMDITQDKEKDIMIERMAYVDEVTDIANRNKFMSIGNEILGCERDDPAIDYWVIVLDIDSFHIINDTCGYANGNHLLREIAAVLTSNLTEGGFAARIGGDNFAMLVRATEDEELPVRLMKRIQLDIANIGGMGIENQNITCSAGYCRMSDCTIGDFAQVLDRAEFALSLNDGSRSALIRYDNRAHDRIIAGNEIEKELTRAVENNELVLYYQPKINLLNGRVIGMEALIRWIKPDGTVVPPSEFIPVAENSLLITKISKFVLHEACRQNKEWQDMGLEPVTVSINLTAIDFYQTNVTESIHEALEETGLAPEWLDVELTESLALKDIDHAVSQMNEIKELGVKLSMDDFGTGYSSLSYIQILPITILKLDRSFIMYLEEDEISREIVSAVIRIAKSKKIETIAEGIETMGQAEILKQSGCDHAQGYFFGKPMPAEQFEVFLRSRQGVKI